MNVLVLSDDLRLLLLLWLLLMLLLLLLLTDRRPKVHHIRREWVLVQGLGRLIDWLADSVAVREEKSRSGRRLKALRLKAGRQKAIVWIERLRQTHQLAHAVGVGRLLLLLEDLLLLWVLQQLLLRLRRKQLRQVDIADRLWTKGTVRMDHGCLLWRLDQLQKRAEEVRKGDWWARAWLYNWHRWWW